MGELFTLTPEIIELGRKAFSDMIVELGKNFTLYYPPTFTECVNCYYDGESQRSSSVYRPGGPSPFSQGQICPVCVGVGGQLTNITEDIRMSVSFDVKTFYDFKLLKDTTYRIGESIMQSRGYIADLPKVIKCEYMVGPLNTQNYIQQRFKLISQPIDVSNIVQARFFVATWKVIS